MSKRDNKRFNDKERKGAPKRGGKNRRDYGDEYSYEPKKRASSAGTRKQGGASAGSRRQGNASGVAKSPARGKAAGRSSRPSRGDEAFSGSAIKKIRIPENTAEISANAFPKETVKDIQKHRNP